MIGKSVPRVDAYEKVTGRAKFTEDLLPKKCLVAKVLHATIGNGIVKSIDTSEAESMEGVVKVVTFHAIGCNSSYISRIMKQELGISFKDFLTRLRISQAMRLMEDRELSINQIAEKVGYSNQHYFSAAFKNCQGMSPSEFRKNMLQIDRNGL